MRTFVIGDVHGQWENLLALLRKASLIENGIRVDATRIIQLGDLGDFRKSTVEGDLNAYHIAAQLGIEVLWGNHDYATQDHNHRFQGYADPPHILRAAIEKVNPKFATHAEGFLLTHAGLHPSYMMAEQLGVERCAEILNSVPALLTDSINDIGWPRNGDAVQGGILWRDADREDLADIPQVFGHTRGYVRGYGNRRFCIDVGARKNHNLAGMWLPEMKVVAVGEDAEINEMALNGEDL